MVGASPYRAARSGPGGTARLAAVVALFAVAALILAGGAAPTFAGTDPTPTETPRPDLRIGGGDGADDADADPTAATDDNPRPTTESGTDEDGDQDGGGDDRDLRIGGGDNDDADGSGFYLSPSFGYVLDFDPDLWDVVDQSSSEGEDVLQLYDGPSFLSVYGTTEYGGDPAACRDDWAEILAQSDAIEGFAPVEDDGEDLVGESATRAFGVYEFGSEDGEERFDLECRVLVPGELILVVILETFAEVYAEEVDARDAVLDTLDLSAVEGALDGAADEGGNATPASGNDPGSDREQDREASPDPGPEDDADATVEPTRRATVDRDETAGDAVTLSDDFTDPAAGLLSTRSPDRTAVRYRYDGGEFVIAIVDPGSGGWQAVVPGEFADVTIEVDARLVANDGGRYLALGCRTAETGADVDEYAFLFDPADGFVALDRWSGGERTTLDEDTLNRGAYEPDDGVNTIALACVGDEIAASVNGEVVLSATDDTLDAGGAYLAAGSYADSPREIEARFDNLGVTGTEA